MGGFASLATGILGGVVAGKQAKDRKERDEKWDTMMAPVYKKLAGVDDKATPPGAAPKDASAPVAPAAPADASVVASPVRPAPAIESRDIEGRANGGMIGSQMPMHHDRMSWQRQSFKK